VTARPPQRRHSAHHRAGSQESLNVKPIAISETIGPTCVGEPSAPTCATPRLLGSIHSNPLLVNQTHADAACRGLLARRTTWPCWRRQLHQRQSQRRPTPSCWPPPKQRASEVRAGGRNLSVCCARDLERQRRWTPPWWPNWRWPSQRLSLWQQARAQAEIQQLSLRRCARLCPAPRTARSWQPVGTNWPMASRAACWKSWPSRLRPGDHKERLTTYSLRCSALGRS